MGSKKWVEKDYKGDDERHAFPRNSENKSKCG